MVSEKNILQTNFEGKQILARNYLANNSYTEKKKYFSWFIMPKKKSHTVVCQQKILSPDRGLGKNFFTQTKSPIHRPTPPPLSPTSNGPAPIKVIQVIKHYPVQKILPVYLISLSTEPHKPLNSGCKKYPPPSPPAKSRLECSTSGRNPFKLKVFRNVTQSVGCLFVAECKEKPSQTFTSPFPLKV